MGPECITKIVVVSLQDAAEKPVEVSEPPNSVANSAPEPSEPATDVKWFGTSIIEMTYGELRRVCAEEGELCS